MTFTIHRCQSPSSVASRICPARRLALHTSMPESATVARRRPSRSNDPDASRKRPASAQSAEMVASKRIAAAVPRYLAFLEYDGARFRGFQRQCGVAATVQGALDEALTAFTGARGAIECVGSSRTDVGVHALRNSAHFDFARTTKDGTTVSYTHLTLPTKA